MSFNSLRIDELEEQVDDLKDQLKADNALARVVLKRAENIEKHRDELEAQLKAVKELVAKQAEDEGLWFEAKTAPEAHLQESLRALHKAVEND